MGAARVGVVVKRADCRLEAHVPREARLGQIARLLCGVGARARGPPFARLKPVVRGLGAVLGEVWRRAALVVCKTNRHHHRRRQLRILRHGNKGRVRIAAIRVQTVPKLDKLRNEAIRRTARATYSTGGTARSATACPRAPRGLPAPDVVWVRVTPPRPLVAQAASESTGRRRWRGLKSRPWPAKLVHSPPAPMPRSREGRVLANGDGVCDGESRSPFHLTR